MQPYPNIVGGFLAQSGSADHAASQFSPQYNITLETSSHSWVLHRLLLMVLYLPNLLSNASTFTVSFSGPNVFSLIFKPPLHLQSPFQSLNGQAGPLSSVTSQSSASASTGSLAIVPQTSEDKFEPKSAVWADTLSRGLVKFEYIWT